MTSDGSAKSPIVSLTSVCKRFPGVTALDHVSLELRAGSIHALVGENGAGKSTLINILCGILQPDDGQVQLDGADVTLADARAARRYGIATVHQEANFFPELTVAENWALEHGWPKLGPFISWRFLRRQTTAALVAVGCSVHPDTPAAVLTAAERQELGIAAALAQSARLLVLDEPTSSLSAVETRRLFARLRQFRDEAGAVLYVSHRLEEVFALADHASVLRDGRKVWSGPISQTTSAQLIACMVGRELESSSDRAATVPGPVRLVCKGLSAADGSFHDVSLEAQAGEILGLYGLIGAGRSEWAQAVVGLRLISAGKIELHGGAWSPRGPADAASRGLAYLPEDRLRQGIFAGLSVRANAVIAALRRLSRGPIVSAKREVQETQASVARLSIRLRSLLQPAGTLSGGNQQKVVLGRWLGCDPDVLILDEPTRGIDVGAKVEIHGLLRRLAAAGKAVIMISSDLPEVVAQSDRIGVFREGRLASVFDARSTSAEQIATAALPLDHSNDDPSAAAREGGRSRFVAVERLREAGVLVAAILVVAILTWRTDTFWQPGTLRNVGENAALLTLCGLGAGLVILAGGIDISFGSVMALAAALAGYLMQEGYSPLLAVPAGLVVSAMCGAANAGICLAGRLHPIVVTLGTMSLYRGLTVLLIGGRDILDVPRSFLTPLRSTPLGMPAAVWLALIAITLAWIILGWTVPGRHILAFGGNPIAAERTGVHRTRVWLAVFSMEGLLAGIAGIIALGLVGSMQSTDFSEKTLEAIGVAVVGGIAITGGRGSVWGIAAAALLFEVLEKGWVLMRISSYWQRTIVGGLLLLAILADRFWRTRKDSRR
jgi:ribose transport system ATP-binding protein/rhamnose transport system ATP-binding protein